jgi:hypothetical protein
VPNTSSCDDDCIKGKASAAALALTTGLPGVPTPKVTLTEDPPTISVTVEYTSTFIFGPLAAAAGAPDGIGLSATATMQRE